MKRLKRNLILLLNITTVALTLNKTIFASEQKELTCYNSGFNGCRIAFGYDTMDKVYDSYNQRYNTLRDYSGLFEYLAISPYNRYGSNTCTCWDNIKDSLSSKYYFADYMASYEDDVITLRPGMGYEGEVYNIKVNGKIVYSGKTELIVMLASDCTAVVEVEPTPSSVSYRYFYTSGYPAVTYNGLVTDSELEVGGHYAPSGASQGFSHNIGYKSITRGDDNYMTLVTNPYTMQEVTIYDKGFRNYTKLPERYGNYSLREDSIYKLNLNQLNQVGNSKEIYAASAFRNIVNHSKIIGKSQSEWYSTRLLLEPTKPSIKYDNGLFNTVDALIKYEPADKTVKSFFIIDLRGVHVENNQQNRDLVDQIYNISTRKNIELFLIGGYDESLFAKLLQR